MTPVLLTRSNLRGVWPALIVPWDANDEVHEARLAEEVRHFAACGVHGVYTGGTTGEFYAQDDAAFERIATVVCQAAREAGLPAQIGCTALSTRTVRRRIGRARTEGASGIQIALPFWLELRDDEVLSFFHAIAEAAGPVPIILYHTSRSKRLLSPQLIGRLAKELPTFIGMKDTGCDAPALAAMLAAAPELAIFGGEHNLAAKSRVGGRGTYSSVTGLNARWIVALYEACARGDWERAAELEAPVARLMHEALIPLVREAGLMDSAVDRLQRIIGGGDVGLACQGPYRSATPEHLRRLREWCAAHVPELLTGP